MASNRFWRVASRFASSFAAVRPDLTACFIMRSSLASAGISSIEAQVAALMPDLPTTVCSTLVPCPQSHKSGHLAVRMPAGNSIGISQQANP